MNGKWAEMASEMPNDVGVSCRFRFSQQIVGESLSFSATCSDLPYISTVLPLENHELLPTFTNGEQRVFDTKPYLDKGVLKRLRERSIFFGVRVVAGSVEWPGEIDFSYDTLYLGSDPVPTDADESRGLVA